MYLSNKRIDASYGIKFFLVRHCSKQAPFTASISGWMLRLMSVAQKLCKELHNVRLSQCRAEPATRVQNGGFDYLQLRVVMMMLTLGKQPPYAMMTDASDVRCG
jgi:hypothetical protein